MSGYLDLQNTLGWIGMKENVCIRGFLIILLLGVIFLSLIMTNSATDFFRSKSVLIWKMLEHCFFGSGIPGKGGIQWGRFFSYLPYASSTTLYDVNTGKVSHRKVLTMVSIDHWHYGIWCPVSGQSGAKPNSQPILNQVHFTLHWFEHQQKVKHMLNQLCSAVATVNVHSLLQKSNE